VCGFAFGLRLVWGVGCNGFGGRWLVRGSVRVLGRGVAVWEWYGCGLMGVGSRARFGASAAGVAWMIAWVWFGLQGGLRGEVGCGVGFV